jgi:hypothetical protein
LSVLTRALWLEVAHQLTRALWPEMAHQLTLFAPARRTPSKKGLVLMWAGHLPHPTKEPLHSLSDHLTLAF